MLESLAIVFFTAILTMGVTEEVVIPTANKVVEVATPVVEQAIEYVLPSTPEE